ARGARARLGRRGWGGEGKGASRPPLVVGGWGFSPVGQRRRGTRQSRRARLRWQRRGCQRRRRAPDLSGEPRGCSGEDPAEELPHVLPGAPIRRGVIRQRDAVVLAVGVGLGIRESLLALL